MTFLDQDYQDSHELDKALKLLCDVALEAGHLAKSLQKSDEIQVRTKKDGSYVSSADLKVNRLIMERLIGACPNYGYLTEEMADHHLRRNYSTSFIVDPIDGTWSFLKGHDDYAINLAIVQEQKITCGVVFEPMSGRLFSARKNGGAYLNGDRLLVNFGSHFLNKPSDAQAVSLMERSIAKKYCEIKDKENSFLNGRGEMIVAIGRRTDIDLLKDRLPDSFFPVGFCSICSLSLRMVHLLTGKVDLAFKTEAVFDWDIAAASITLREAGANVSTIDNKNLLFDRQDPINPSMIAYRPDTKSRVASALASRR